MYLWTSITLYLGLFASAQHNANDSTGFNDVKVSSNKVPVCLLPIISNWNTTFLLYFNFSKIVRLTTSVFSTRQEYVVILPHTPAT